MLAQRRRICQRNTFKAAVLVAGLMSCDSGKPAHQATSAPSLTEFPVYSPPPSALVPRARWELDKSHMVDAGGFLIDQYEAHVVELVDGRQVPHPFNFPICAERGDFRDKGFVYGYFERQDKDPECKEKLGRIFAKSVPGVRPQGYISQPQAKAACENAGKRLCTHKEWVKACKGPSDLKFSYGNAVDSGVCNLGGPHHLSEFFGSDAKDWTYEDFNHPRLNERPGFLALTGAHKGCRSDLTPEKCRKDPALLGCSADSGVYDMLGNLQEWVSDERTFVGGFYSNPANLEEVRAAGQGCDYQIARAHGKNYHDYSQGFRCCLDIQKKKD